MLKLLRLFVSKLLITFAISSERGLNSLLGTSELILFITFPKNAFPLISDATYLKTYSSSSVINGDS